MHEQNQWSGTGLDTVDANAVHVLDSVAKINIAHRRHRTRPTRANPKSGLTGSRSDFTIGRG